MIIIMFLKDTTDHSFSCLPLNSDQHNLIIRIGIWAYWERSKVSTLLISLLWINEKIQFIYTDWSFMYLATCKVKVKYIFHINAIQFSCKHTCTFGRGLPTSSHAPCLFWCYPIQHQSHPGQRKVQACSYKGTEMHFFKLENKHTNLLLKFFCRSLLHLE